jgi:hypothetical protein
MRFSIDKESLALESTSNELRIISCIWNFKVIDWQEPHRQSNVAEFTILGQQEQRKEEARMWKVMNTVVVDNYMNRQVGTELIDLFDAKGCQMMMRWFMLDLRYSKFTQKRWRSESAIRFLIPDPKS